MKDNEMSLPLHLSYLGLYAVGVVAALWQKGHPALTLVVLGAILPLGLVSRIPHRWFPEWVRQWAQAAIAIGGVAWLHSRYTQVTPDLCLVEATAVFGLALTVSGVHREYGLMALISFILAGYGGIAATRSIYLPAFAVYLLFAMLLLYQTRTLKLAAVPGTATPTATVKYRGNWGYRCAHLFLVCVGFALIVATCPFPRARSVGLVPVSFETSQELEFPLLWRHWIAPTTKVVVSDKGTETTEQGKMPSAISKDARQQLEAEEAEASFDSRDGGGSGTPGKDLVFRVKAPGKLYWLGQLYDLYDGETWRISETLHGGTHHVDSSQFFGFQRINQFFSIEKDLSRRLFGAYRAYQYTWEEKRDEGTSSSAAYRNRRNMIWNRQVYGATLVGEKPPLPWRYQCWSVVPSLTAGDAEQPGRAARNAVKRPVGESYLHVAPELVTDRLRELAEELTAGRGTALAKAFALRDYLRENYSYNITTKPIPTDAEVVDHFLFESKEGYCQHFAQALTVLARLAGLPARLATGYSPGHYNLLTGHFEVHEYHAHAWTQIFVDHYGWLTFDGAPPGELSLRTTPPIMGSILDPFGDEWSARPPELTIAPQVRPRPSSEHGDTSAVQKKEPGRLSQTSQKVYQDAVAASGKSTPDFKDLAAAAGRELKSQFKRLWQQFKQTCIGWVRELKNTTMRAANAVVAFVRGLTWRGYAMLLTAAVLVLLLVHMQPSFARVYHAWTAKRRCSKLWAMLDTTSQTDPAAAVGLCYRIAGELLALEHYRRPGNLDVLEYVEYLGHREPQLAANLRVISTLFTRKLFSTTVLTRKDAEAAKRSTINLRSTLTHNDARNRKTCR